MSARHFYCCVGIWCYGKTLTNMLIALRIMRIVSMVDGELFDKLEEIARKVRKKDKPFGGIQVVNAT